MPRPRAQGQWNITTPRTATISFFVELELLGTVPDAEGLDRSRLGALGGCEPSGGELVGGLVQGAQAGHRSPVAVQEV